MPVSIKVRPNPDAGVEKNVRGFIAIHKAEGILFPNVANKDHPVVFVSVDDPLLLSSDLVLSPDQLQILHRITSLNLAGLTDEWLETLEAFFLKGRCCCLNPLRIKECLVYTPRNGVVIIGLDYERRKPCLFERFLYNFDRLPPLSDYHFIVHQVCDMCNQAVFGAVFSSNNADETTKEAFSEHVQRMTAIAAQGFVMQGGQGQKLVFESADSLFDPEWLAGCFGELRAVERS